jgi:site-specific DNA recombinase
VPGPFGRPWGDTTIRGHITRGTGILNNELYIGRLVWNRLRYMKDPTTGRRRSRLNGSDHLITEEVPDLRIVDDELWAAVKTRQTTIRESEGVSKAQSTRFWERRRAQHLLTGLTYCGSCDGRLASVGRDYLACSAARGQGTCSNRKAIRRAPLEALILDGLKHRLLAPELVEEFVAAYHEEVNRARRDATAARAGQERELAEVKTGRRGCNSAWTTSRPGRRRSSRSWRPSHRRRSGCTRTWPRSTGPRSSACTRRWPIDRSAPRRWASCAG